MGLVVYSERNRTGTTLAVWVVGSGTTVDCESSRSHEEEPIGGPDMLSSAAQMRGAIDIWSVSVAAKFMTHVQTARGDISSAMKATKCSLDSGFAPICCQC